MTCAVPVEPLAGADRVWPLVVVGGGPGAARQVAAAGLPAADVLVVTQAVGGWMRVLGRSRLQSYVGELVLDEEGALRRRIGDVDLQPSGDEYADYVADWLRRHVGTIVAGTAGDVRRADGLLHVDVTDPAGGTTTVRASRVVVATGARPRRPPEQLARAGAMTFEAVYRDLRNGRTEPYAGRSVVVVGSGNSALQTAALLSNLAEDVTILTLRYVGMYPQETQDRFAWRAPSQLACELVAKSAQRCPDSGISTMPCVRMLVYDRIELDGDELAFTYRRDANRARLCACSLPPRCSHARTRSVTLGDGWRETRDRDSTVLVWATGVEPVYPAGGVLDTLPRDRSGYIVGPGPGLTPVPGLYLAGSCTGARAVNEMTCSSITGRDDLAAADR